MGFDKVKIRQIRNLILMTAGLVLVIMYSGKILDMIWLRYFIHVYRRRCGSLCN